MQFEGAVTVPCPGAFKEQEAYCECNRGGEQERTVTEETYTLKGSYNSPG